MKDQREPLKNGTVIKLDEQRNIEIINELGKGASCIVYDAVYTDNIGVQHKMRIKESYPYFLSLTRQPDGSIIPQDSEKEKFEEEKKRFIESYKRNTKLRNTLGIMNSTINATEIIHFNQTVYIMMTMDEGIDYKTYEDDSLREVFEHIKALAVLISKYHQNGFLHMDIKPENVLILPETREHLFLFDYDTVTTKEEIVKNGRFRLSFSEGFSAAEQIQGKYKKIGTHTDIYSIGALAYYKLFGKLAGAEEGSISYVYQFDDFKYADVLYQPKLYKKLSEFFKKTLATSTVARWHDAKDVIKALEELINLSDADSAYMVDSFHYNRACFVGRQTELEAIHTILEENQLAFLSGIGGIGKTELAKRYAYQYRKQYNSVVFATFRDSIVTMVCDEIDVHQVSREEEETDQTFFERKLSVLKKTVDENDLIIIDNFDVTEDENLEALFECPCKFIVTTREDFRDYDYPQITVGKIGDMEEMLSLFRAYNEEGYSDEEQKYIGKLMEFVDYHTMMVEMLAKYLRVTGESPKDLYEKFLEKEGVTNTKESQIRQRKDKKLYQESVNNHLKILFDVYSFDERQKEIISSLSLLAGIRIRKIRFEELCRVEEVDRCLETLIKSGWIQYDEEGEKISLHPIIQDLIYKELEPTDVSCPGIMEGMTEYAMQKIKIYDKKRTRRQVLDVFVNRIKGTSLSYAKLCIYHGRRESLDKAEALCLQLKDKESFDVLQKLYRKRIQAEGDSFEWTEPGFELEAAIRSKFPKVLNWMKLALEACEKYDDRKEYRVKQQVEICAEVDEQLKCDGYFWGEENGEDENLDKIYALINEVYEKATKQLPMLSFSNLEKAELYEKMQKFYVEEDFLARYRCKKYGDLEKAFWYQECAGKLRANSLCAEHLYEKGLCTENQQTEMMCEKSICTESPYNDNLPQKNDEKIKISTSDIFMSELAESYAKKKDYDKAIVCYKKAYEQEEIFYEEAMQETANLYLLMGKWEMAAESLKLILKKDKEQMETYQEEGLYSNHICAELIKLLAGHKQTEEAKKYAKEMISFNLANSGADASEYELEYLLVSYYNLFLLEENEKVKEELWEKCLSYFEKLGESEIDEELFDFVDSYIHVTDIDEDEKAKIVERLDSWTGAKRKDKLLNDLLEACEKKMKVSSISEKKKLQKRYVGLLIKLAENAEAYPNDDAKMALEYCKMAQNRYEQYGMEDELLQSTILDLQSKAMSDLEDYDSEEIEDIQKQCNYELLAERKCKELKNTKEITEEIKKTIEIWQDAAREYRFIECYEKETACLLKALEIVRPVFNQYDFTSFETGYWEIMQNLIFSYIHDNQKEKAYKTVEEVYLQLLQYLSNGRKKKDYHNSSWWVRQLAEALEMLSENQLAMRLYAVGLFLELEEHPEMALLRKLFTSEMEWEELYKRVIEALQMNYIEEKTDCIVDLKNSMVQLQKNNNQSLGEESDYCRELSEIIGRYYQNSEIEFKSKNNS